MYLFSLEKNRQLQKFAKQKQTWSFLTTINFVLSPLPPHFFSIKYDQKVAHLNKKKRLQKLKQKRSDELINLTNNFE